MPSFPGEPLLDGTVLLFASRIMNEGRELRDEQDLVVQAVRISAKGKPTQRPCFGLQLASMKRQAASIQMLTPR